jgi:hypothetical protein
MLALTYNFFIIFSKDEGLNGNTKFYIKFLYLFPYLKIILFENTRKYL